MFKSNIFQSYSFNSRFFNADSALGGTVDISSNLFGSSSIYANLNTGFGAILKIWDGITWGSGISKVSINSFEVKSMKFWTGSEWSEIDTGS